MQEQGRGRLAAIALSALTLVATRGRAHMAGMFGWAAPDPGVGRVTFYLAGNVVNGKCRPDQGDLWSVASGFVVAQKGP